MVGSEGDGTSRPLMNGSCRDKPQGCYIWVSSGVAGADKGPPFSSVDACRLRLAGLLGKSSMT